MLGKEDKRFVSYVSIDKAELSSYLEEISKIPLLSREQEYYHAKRAAAGNEESKEIMIRSNLRFVVNIARQYRNKNIELADMISEGNIGLMQAVDRFDAEKGYHFISYAVWWIRQAILKGVCEKSRPIRLPLNRVNELVQIEKLSEDMQDVNGEAKKIDHIAEQLNMGKRHVANLLNISRDIVSLDMTINTGGHTTVLHEMIEGSSDGSPEDAMVNTSLKEEIRSLLSCLTKRESEILQDRFGLNGRKAQSLQEIGKMQGLTKERVRQISKQAIQKIQNPYYTRRLEEYVY